MNEMTKLQVLECLDQLWSVVERLPDETTYIHPYLDTSDCIPEIHFCGDASFVAAAGLFSAQTTVTAYSEKYDREEFFVNGVRMFRLLRKPEFDEEEMKDDEHNDADGLPEDSPDSETAEETRMERGCDESGHQADGEYPS